MRSRGLLGSTASHESIQSSVGEFCGIESERENTHHVADIHDATRMHMPTNDPIGFCRGAQDVSFTCNCPYCGAGVMGKTRPLSTLVDVDWCSLCRIQE